MHEPLIHLTSRRSQKGRAGANFDRASAADGDIATLAENCQLVPCGRPVAFNRGFVPAFLAVGLQIAVHTCAKLECSG